MNVETGEIKEERELTAKQLLSGKWKRIGKRPNPGCKKCHGRGYLGRDIVRNEMVECPCVKVPPPDPLTEIPLKGYDK